MTFPYAAGGIARWCVGASFVVACTFLPAANASAADNTTLVAAIGGLSGMDWSPAKSGGDEEKLLIMMQDGLTQLNPKTFKLEGALAESWEVSPDGKVWTFKLKPNIKFQGGYGNVTSEDVKFS